MFKKIAWLIWPNWKAAAPLRLVQQRFLISQQPPPPSLPFTHSPPLTGSLLRRSLRTCPVAIYNCSFLHNERRERKSKTGFTHERGQQAFFLAATIKQNRKYIYIYISASSIKYQTSGFSRKKEEAITSVLQGFFPMKHRDSHEKICSHEEKKETDKENLNPQESNLY